MFCSKILVAYDESPLSEKALEKAAALAADPSVEIDIVYTIDIPFVQGIDQFTAKSISDAFRQKGKEVLDNAASKIPGCRRIKTFLKENKSPSAAILDLAKEEGCDLIIMGSRGLSGLKEMLGSVSHSVAQRASVPVLIIK